MTAPASTQPTLEEKLPKRADVAQMTSVHTTFDTRIFAKTSRSLARAGYKVVLVSQSDKNQCIDDVQIFGVKPSESRILRIFRVTFDVTNAAIASKAAVCHFHDPELMPAGIILKMLGRRVIYDVHEDYPRTIATKEWLPAFLRGPLAKIAAAAEWITSLVADLIVVATPAIACRFPPAKTVLVQNFPIADELVASDDTPFSSRPNNIAYVGDVTRIRGAIEMVKAMDLLPDQHHARLQLVGNITPANLCDEMKTTPGWQRVDVLGYCARPAVREMMAKAKVGLVLFHSHPNHINAQPNKLFEYMSAGLPVIASDFPLWREIIKSVDAGILVDPMEPASIADAITWILEHPEDAEKMGARGKQAVKSIYNWEQEEKKLIQAYGRLIGRPSGNPVQ